MPVIITFLVWERRIDGGDNDMCYKVMVDNGQPVISGNYGNNVYVAQLNPADGSFLWQYIFAFPGTGRSNVKDLGIDPIDGYIVGAGTSYPYSGDNTACGYVVKLNSGIKVWDYIDSIGGCSRRPGFSGLTVDEYTSSYYAYGTDYENYSSSWFGSTRRFTVKINRSTGQRLWIYEPGGYTYTDGYTNPDTTLIFVGFGARGEVQKISTGGSQIWSYTDPSNSRYYGVYTGSNKHPIVIGYSSDGRPNEDFVVIQFQRETGGIRWRYFKNGGGNSTDAAMDVLVDGNNSIYAVGYLDNGVSRLDGYVVKLDSMGNMIWQYTYNGPANSDDYFDGITLMSDGNILVYGYSTGMGSGLDFFLVKLNSITGDTIWTYRYNSPYSDNDAVMSVDTYGGDVYACGYSYSTPTNRDILVIKLSDPTSVEVSKEKTKTCKGDIRIYDILGRYVGNSTKNLRRGVYFIRCENGLVSTIRLH
ncbi:MAG: PQQ-binding-like beta-propeller repeat protein [candidate division WOR-3 bacterium]